MRTSYLDFEHACRTADEYKTANEKNMAKKFELQTEVERLKVELERSQKHSTDHASFCDRLDNERLEMIANMSTTIIALTDRLREAEETIQFYASFESWENFAATGCCIIEEDYDVDDAAGGKRARQYISKHKGKV